MNPSPSAGDAVALDGPDYVALVIEWADADDDAVTTVSARAPAPSVSNKHNLVTVVGALGALALATWGLRRLRATS